MVSSATDPFSLGLLAQAVADRRYEDVRHLLEAGASPDDRDERGVSALLVAAESNQFRMANLLIDHGADVWTAEKLGFTVANLSVHERVDPTSAEGIARSRLIGRLRALGYPWPPPNSLTVERLMREGRWPPPGKIAPSR
jgi:hypothetical protein